MPATGVRITGLREAIRNLEKLGVSVEDLKEAFGEISREVVADALGIVRRLTGALAGTIRPARTKNKAVVRAGTPSGSPQAGVLNYGWPAHNIAADEFLTGPANDDVPGKVRRIEDNLESLIRRYNLR